MKNSELKNKLSQDKKTAFTKCVTIDELYQLYKDNNLDISLFEKTEDGSLKNIDDRLVSNYTFVKCTKANAESVIRCIVAEEESIEKNVVKFPLSVDARIEFTVKGEALIEDKLPFGGSTNLFLRLKLVDIEDHKIALDNVWGGSPASAENEMKKFVEKYYPECEICSIETVHHSEFDLIAYEARALVKLRKN